ncbi:MAG: YdeI/OmpD-associated family protein [Pseudomonadota bacterium]
MLADTPYPHMFNAPLEAMYGDSGYIGLVVPEDYKPRLPFDTSPRIRVKGEMNGNYVEGAFVPLAGKHYIMVSKRLRKLIGAEVGDIVNFCFEIADPNEVRTPPELAEVFAEDTEMAERWETWPKGKRRSLFYKFEKAKTVATKQRYVEQTLEELLTMETAR